MFHRFLIAILLVALPLGAHAESPQPRPDYEIEVYGDIQIGPDGLVREYTLKTRLMSMLADTVDRSVRAWKFVPIEVEGKPVIAKTRMRLVLMAKPIQDDQYALQVQQVFFGQPEYQQRMAPPYYPPQAARANVGAKVTLVLRLDPEGRVVDIWPEQTSLTASGDGKRADEWRATFEQASIDAAKKWKFTIGEEVNGVPVESIVRVPLLYSKNSNKGWQSFIPGPVHPIPPAISDGMAMQAARDSLGDGETQSLNSRFRLRDEVVGTTL